MKYFCYYAVFIAISYLIPNKGMAQNCPVKIGYSDDYPCNGLPTPGFYMEFTSPFIGSTVAYTNFTGNSDPDCLYFSLQNPPCSDYYLVDINPPICTNLTPTGTIIFLNSNTVCHYENGNFTYATSQECEDFMMACKDPLLSFAKHFIPDPPDCKLWEGPCATESGIWRNGAVAIGAPVSPLKLTVKGGITTEMLQICQPAWCDYVFSDTFRLRPLGEVEAFIRAYRFLPGCTPGKVIDAQGGFFLDVETVNQQQKIEEIFLHLIDIQKRLDRLDKKLPAATTRANTTAELPEMKDFIKSARVVQIECFQINPALAGVANGTGGIVVTPGGGPFNISWNGGQINNLQCDGTIKITGLAAGSYNITVSNGSGVVGTCAFSIAVGTSADCSIFENPACRQAIVDMLSAEAFSASPDCRQWEGDPCSHDGNIYRLGNVGIGTDKMRSGYSIAVKDGILTDKFRVELCETSGWCDYVFDPGYPLPGLYELEQYLNVYRHLPGSISQDEVSQNGGFEMRSVKIDQQKKIEEGYLYLIELNNKKKELQKKLTAYYEQN